MQSEKHARSYFIIFYNENILTSHEEKKNSVYILNTERSICDVLRKRIANEIKIFDNLINDHFIQFLSNGNIALCYKNVETKLRDNIFSIYYKNQMNKMN